MTFGQRLEGGREGAWWGSIAGTFLGEITASARAWGVGGAWSCLRSHFILAGAERVKGRVVPDEVRTERELNSFRAR